MIQPLSRLHELSLCALKERRLASAWAVPNRPSLGTANRVVGIEMLNLTLRAPAADTHRLFLHGVEAASLVGVLREEPPEDRT